MFRIILITNLMNDNNNILEIYSIYASYLILILSF